MARKEKGRKLSSQNSSELSAGRSSAKRQILSLSPISSVAIFVIQDNQESLHAEFGTYGQIIEATFREVLPQADYTIYSISKFQYPKPLLKHDLYVISGSNHDVYSEEAFLKKFFSNLALIVKNKKSLLGICFGHQALAKAMNGKIKTSHNDWNIGLRKYKMKEKLFSTLEADHSFSLPAFHKDRVAEIPSGALHYLELRGNETRERDESYDGIFYPSIHSISIQAHPEFSVNYEYHLLDDPRRKIPISVRTAEKKALEEHRDRKHSGSLILYEMLNWIIMSKEREKPLQ